MTSSYDGGGLNVSLPGELEALCSDGKCLLSSVCTSE